ncbi:uncharacterized protein BO80DRAFT_87088 [Aspergillus ibericus CBS 121593]|uniref:Uncharacterized protein n=1 Tax=Aspergillus ibericus CBS 121593 TaxID=1448316 RepID=A0A395HED7_9EURO|nr:hypothetical protein BO80DRAFT_87088 [Aspergillus ibericus CBS 121593]RAL06026.1 hypothetical protein BO80DRAFT_87088 [Aspergillus ibericus CBS 121593]
MKAPVSCLKCSRNCNYVYIPLSLILSPHSTNSSSQNCQPMIVRDIKERASSKRMVKYHLSNSKSDQQLPCNGRTGLRASSSSTR